MSYGFMIITVVFAIGLGILLAKFYLTDQRRMTSNTIARVVSAEQRVVIDEKARRTETEVVASFTAGGHEHTVKRVLKGERARQFPPGREVPVRYNPGRPWMAELVLS
jgi:hypothetical protein